MSGLIANSSKNEWPIGPFLNIMDIDAISIIIFLPSPLSLDLSIEFENDSIATRMRSLLLNKKQKR
tara:strand:+ start:178 stop:375 length:198 start_codon:yes stop_codon:yes gene_type:complete